MASVGPRNPGTIVDDAAVGTVVWSNPGNAATSDNAYAQVLLMFGDDTSHYLKATNFGFQSSESGQPGYVPPGATINGIVVEIERKASGALIADSIVKLVKGGTVSGNNKAVVEEWPLSDTYKTYGGASDLWGVTLTPADVTATSFGVVLSAYSLNEDDVTGDVDHIRITIYYTSTTAVGASDSGAGSEAVSVSVTVAAAETGSGAEVSTLLGMPTVADSGSGTDALGLLANPLQEARPALDAYIGESVREDYTNVNLYQSIDEGEPTDNDYVASALRPVNSVYVTKLSPLSVPPTRTDHKLKVRYRKHGRNNQNGYGVTDTPQVDLVVQLRQGYVSEANQGTLIYSQAINNIGPTETTLEIAIPEASAANITDYSNLYVRVQANQSTIPDD